MKGLQLKRLEAYGFKSFADKLEIEFDKGITAIVGPNGSGKSNITDAIRWVLGEQNVRNLRGAKAEDVIFTGSASRRALGVADVSLTFDNSDGQLALDFKEVVVTRRLFRSGESEFYINKAKCRLKDIYDLFADTGLGRDAISVISQNKIDQVLNSKPEERRLLFEETAGITKYRNRKRESLRKLEDTEQNLLRIHDIVNEIENQLEPLAGQAEKTKQYNVLQEEYKDCKLTQLLHKYEKCSWEMNEGKKKLRQLRDAELGNQAQVQLLEASKEQLGKELLDVESSLKLLGEKNHELGQKIERNNSEIAILQERLNQAGRSRQRLEIDKAEICQRELGTQQRSETLAADKQKLEAKLAQIEVQLAKDLAGEALLQEKLQAQTTVLQQLQEKLQRQERELSEKSQSLALVERDLLENERQLREQTALREKVQQEQAVQDREMQVLQAAAEKMTAELSQRSQQKTALESELAVAAAENRKLTEAMGQVQQLRQNAEARLKVLANLQKEYEGFGRAVKSVLKTSLPWKAGVCGAVAELITVPKRYVTAIEIALGGSLQNVVTEDATTAKAAIAFLKKERLGRVTFLPLSTIVVRQPAIDSLVLKAPGFIGYANELVQVETKYQKAIDFLLARTIIVDTVDHALQLAKTQGYKARLVTLEGEVLNPGGSLAGGSSAHRESSFLNRSGDIEQLSGQLHEAETKLLGLQGEKKAAAEKQNELEGILRQLQQAEHKAAVQQAEQKIYIEKKAAEQKALAENMQGLLVKIDKVQADRQSFAEQKNILQADISLLQGTGTVQRADDAAAVELLDDLQQDYDDLAKLIVDRKIERTVAEQEVIRSRENWENLQAELERYQAELAKNKAEEIALGEMMEESRRQIETLQNANKSVQSLKDIGTKDYDNFYQVKMMKLVDIQKNDRESKQAGRMLADSQNKIHGLELETTKYDFEVKQCMEALQETYQLTPEAAGAHKLDLPLQALQSRIRELESAIAALGAVNPNAIAEYEAVNTRYAFLQKQSQDLIVAKEYLAGIIQEMDATMSKQFKEAFAVISEYFSEIFVRLFGGGQAKLLLTDTADVLSAGVEIEVQPPEKKLQNLAVLSGGERALTVIALLFAFLKYRPAPFSVVDEIDAPLDEANVNRFGAFLQEYAEQTQFIVVTHRKGTMEAANVMFGVTIEDAGVSKIVSVRLEEQLN